MQTQNHIPDPRRIIFLICTVFIFCTPVKSQQSRIYTIAGSGIIGNNVNDPSDREFGNTTPIGVELYFHHDRNGSKYWEKYFNYPQTGWAFTWIDHRNNLLGSSYVASRYVNFIFLRKKWFEFYIKGSQGIMFATSIYGSGDNAKEKYNNAMSQHFNFSEQIGLGLNIYAAKHLYFNLSNTVTHFSNGALSQPNDGLNLWMLQFGLGYVIGDRLNIQYKQPEKPMDDKRIKFNIIAAGGVKQLVPENERKYPLLTFCFYADKKFTKANAINIGVDVFLNSGIKHEIENSSSKGTDFKRVGVSAGHEFFIDRVGILTQLGYHVYSPYASPSSFYQKAGLKYYISDKLFVALTLRGFKWHISDEVSWGIGLRL